MSARMTSSDQKQSSEQASNPTIMLVTPFGQGPLGPRGSIPLPVHMLGCSSMVLTQLALSTDLPIGIAGRDRPFRMARLRWLLQLLALGAAISVWFSVGSETEMPRDSSSQSLRHILC